ncbi:MAG: PQQ-binding-like beta-propeller repeat protein [Candidatus Limiplasma sp.]|nr:PQQ-binding-like beta-propeller repeat protein [Candidatus Limiplasma sp.]
MSDFFDKDTGKAAGRPDEVNPWQQDPFAAYDDPAMNPAGTGVPLPDAEEEDAAYAPKRSAAPDYSAWRRPGAAARAASGPDRLQIPADAPDFTRTAPFGTEQPAKAAQEDYGVVDVNAAPNPYAPPKPAYASFTAPSEGDFAQMGADAPTRISRPVGGQMVSKSKTVEHAANPFERMDAPAPTAQPAPTTAQDAADAAPRRRRAGRMARYEGAAETPAALQPDAPYAPLSAPAPEDAPAAPRRAVPPAFPPEGRERMPAAVDPCEAGDSEADDLHASLPNPEEDFPRTPRRPAAPGGRYTGARTALPQSVQRRDIPDEDAAEPQAQGAMNQPQEGRRPQGVPGQRPVRLDENGRPIPMQRPQGVPGTRPAQDDPYAARQPEGMDPRRRMRMEEEQDEPQRFDPRRGYPDMQPRASVERPAYDFEDEADEGEPRRRGGVLIPLVVVLLVLGGLLAGIVLPDWDGMDTGLGQAMGKIKGAVVGMFDGVKTLIFPEEEGVKSISVNPASATAPVELVFNVQASTAVTDIRILDAGGVEVLAKTLTDGSMLAGEVTQNSRYNIWTLRYSVEDGYEGVFTAQAKKKDGTWEEGITLETPVSIAPPAVVEPPVQDFAVDQADGATPAAIAFTVVTSQDVTAVQIVNDYGDPVAEMYLSDAGAQVVEDALTRTWSLSAQVADPYTGSFFACYQTDHDITFTQSDFEVDVTYAAAQDAPADAGSLAALQGDSLGGDAPADAPADGADAPQGADGAADAAGADGANAQADAPADGAAFPADASLTADAAGQPADAASATPVATPAPTPLPLLAAAADASADPAAIKLATFAYEGTTKKEGYDRAKKIVITEPYKYAIWDQSGVLTFRGDPLRQNAAYGTVDIQSKALTEIWKVPMEGNVRAKSGSLTGVSWPGQPIIVKWPTQLRAILAMTDEAKNKQALKETIVAGQNGKIYFLDLVTGEPTREAISVEWPSNGVVSLQTNASPMLAVGQHFGVLATKTVENGLHLYNLMNNKELTMLKGKEKLMRSNYSGINSSPLFDKNTGTMIVGGQNGILYTMEMNDAFDHVLATLKLDPATQRYTWLAGKQKEKNTNIDGSVAMYGSYAYFGDQTGIVQCVDVNTLTPVWAVNTGDNVDATIALDMESDTAVSLYTANTILGQGRTGVSTIRKLDALTGKELWAFQVPELTYTTEASVGVVASPVVGQGNVSDLVYFTATNGTRPATLYALSKSTGSVRWSLALSSPSVSSPVAVYNDAGDAWIIQGESGGALSLVDAKSGTLLTSLQLEGSIEASPAVYRDVLVIATTGKDKSYIYGIKLE